MRSIRALKPNVTREDAIERFTAARWWTGLTATLPSTRTIAELYIPYRIFRVEISQGDHPEIRFLGIDAASGHPRTVNLAMDLVHPGGSVVVAGMKDGPLEGFHSDWIPTRRITIHPGAGLDTEGAVALINAGKVPTTALLGDTFPLDRFEDAFSLLTRSSPGRDSVRVALQLA